MSSYGFRIRFLLPEYRRIEHNTEILQILLPTGDKEVLLKSVPKVKIKDSINLAVFASGFSSKCEADNCGRKVRNSLLLCGPHLQMGFDVGKDKARFIITEYGRKWLKKMMKLKEETTILNDIHGLCVYPEEKGVGVRFAGSLASFQVGVSSTKFVEEFTKAYDLDPQLSDKQWLALEVYNSSHFESSLRMRFLTLVVAVECLCIQKTRPEPVICHLRKLIEITEKIDLESSEKSSFLHCLKNLKKESISKSCRQLVKKYLGDEMETLFKDCYDIRSRILHNGSVPEGKDIGTYTPKLDKLVSQLILADIDCGLDG